MKHFTLYPGRQTQRECQSDSKVQKDAAICGSASILSLCVWVGYGSKMNAPGLKALLRFSIFDLDFSTLYNGMISELLVYMCSQLY